MEAESGRRRKTIGFKNRGGKVSRFDPLGFGDPSGALNRILQLAHIARIMVRQEESLRFATKTFRFAFTLGVEPSPGNAAAVVECRHDARVKEVIEGPPH